MKGRARDKSVSIMVCCHDYCCLCLQDCGRERGYVCVVCDRALCPFCIRVVCGEMLCRLCAGEESET